MPAFSRVELDEESPPPPPPPVEKEGSDISSVIGLLLMGQALWEWREAQQRRIDLKVWEEAVDEWQAVDDYLSWRLPVAAGM